MIVLEVFSLESVKYYNICIIADVMSTDGQSNWTFSDQASGLRGWTLKT